MALYAEAFTQGNINTNFAILDNDDDTPVSGLSIINQLQTTNLGADLYNGALL